jgi:hypothetical protein
MKPIRFLILPTLFAAGLAATTAQAQYYGGVALSEPKNATAFGFNGGERLSEIIGLQQMARGLTLSSEPSLGMKLGYRFTPHFSLEGAYADRAALTANNIFTPDARQLRERSVGLNLVGSVTVFKALSIQGRAGVRSENDLTGLNGTARNSNAGALGVGVQYNFNSSLGLRFEVEKTRRFFSDRATQDNENVSFGVLWRF